MKQILRGCYEVLLITSLLIFIVEPAFAADVQMNGDTNVTGNVTATSFTGSGAGLTGILGTAISNTSITVNQLADNAVTAAKIEDNAVTPGKIAFFSRVAVVAINGGDYTDPSVAMSSGAYGFWCGLSSQTNPCLLKIMPGVYNIGTASVQMRPYVDIEGSGENTTIIQGNIDSAVSGVVSGASNSEMRFLTVKNSGGGSYSQAIYNSGAATKITNVTAMATGSSHNYAVVNQNSSSPVLLNVSAIASGGTISIGVYNLDSSAMMFNVTSVATGGGSNIGVSNNSTSGLHTVTIRSSVISGSSYSISNSDNSTITTLVGNTQLVSGHTPSTYGSVTCAGMYDVNYLFSPNTCP